MSGKKHGASGVDNTHRKTWDREEFHEKAKKREIKEKEAEDSKIDARKRKRLERDPLHLGMIVERAKLKPRDHEIDLAAKLNKSQVQSFSMDPNQQGGYYCDVCDCSLKDSLAYLDHINGKYHNRNLGMSMEVERSTVDQVRKRLEIAKKKKRGLYVEPDEAGDTKYLTYDEKDEDEYDEENDDGSKGSDEGEDSETQEMAKLMGFGSFGGE